MWYTLGMISLAFAYIGFVTPGIPFSIFLVFSAYCFSKSSKRMHDYLYNHKHFGPFLTNFVEKRIFPTKAKYAMVTVMSSSLLFLWFTTYNLNALLWSTGFSWQWLRPTAGHNIQAPKRNTKREKTFHKLYNVHYEKQNTI